MKGRNGIVILVLTLLMGSVFAGAETVNTKESNSEPKPLLMEGAELSITVDYVTNDYSLGLDQLDWILPEGESPEWWYRITVFNDQGGSQEIVHESGTSAYTWNVQETHDFPDCASNAYIHIEIELWDNDDFWAGVFSEQADISARDDDDQKTFRANYDLSTNTLSTASGEDWISQGNGWYLLTGDLDETAGHDNDDNDANMRIQITDNLEPLKITTFKVKESLENNNVPPGQEITFVVEFEGGLPTFEYNLWPCGGGRKITGTSNNREIEIPCTYKTEEHGSHFPYISIDGSQNSGGTAYGAEITVNNRPGRPSKPTMKHILGGYRYETTATDPDDDPLQYQWEIDDVAQSWGTYNYYEQQGKASKVRVRVRDKPGGDWNDGLITGWSEPKPKIFTFGASEIIKQFLERIPLLAKIMNFLN